MKGLGDAIGFNTWFSTSLVMRKRVPKMPKCLEANKPPNNVSARVWLPVSNSLLSEKQQHAENHCPARNYHQPGTPIRHSRCGSRCQCCGEASGSNQHNRNINRNARHRQSTEQRNEIAND